MSRFFREEIMTRDKNINWKENNFKRKLRFSRTINQRERYASINSVLFGRSHTSWRFAPL